MVDTELTVLQNLTALREGAGLSQRAVEQKLGLRRNTLYDIEKGRLKLPFIMAAQLMELYHADIRELLQSAEPAAPLTEKNDSSPAPFASLMSLGVISGATHPLSEAMAHDPVIIAEIGVGQLGKKPMMELLLDKLTDSQKRFFVLDTYRYINSLISADGDIRRSELTLRDALIFRGQLTLTDSEKKSIARALRKPFFGKSTAKSLPRDAYKHFLIWTLHLVSRVHGTPHFKYLEYIQAVAEHVQLPMSAQRYIDEQVHLAYADDV